MTSLKKKDESVDDYLERMLDKVVLKRVMADIEKEQRKKREQQHKQSL